MIADGNTVTISYDGTNGFGANGPGSTATIQLFDDASNYSGTPQSTPISDSWPVIGSYLSGAQVDGQVDSGGRGSSGFCRLISYITQTDRDNSGGGGRIMWIGFGPGATYSNINEVVTEIYIFRATKFVQVGTYSGSFWKTAWIFYGPNGYGDDTFDLVIPTFSQGENSVWFDGAIGGEYNIPNFGITTSIDTTGGWNLWESWFQMATTQGQDDTLQFRSTCHNTNTDTGVVNTVISSAGTERGWDRVTDPGWMAGASGDTRITGNNQIDEQDTYVCTSQYTTTQGPGGAAARVMIGNASTLSACTDLAICTPTSWSNTSITCTIRRGGFNPMSGQGLYLFVLNASSAIVPYGASQGRLIS